MCKTAVIEMARGSDFEPDTFEMLLEGVRQLDRAQLEVKRAAEAWQAAVEKVERLKAGLREISELAGLVVKQQSSSTKDGLEYLKDSKMPVRWRIAFYLLVHPQLDYQFVAEQLWGPGLDPKVAKNRVNAHVTSLKHDEVALPIGRATYKIVPERLHELSKLPLPAGAIPEEADDM